MKGYIGNTGHVKIIKISTFILVLGVQKTDVYDFSGFFYEKNLEIQESRVRRRFRESRVRRRRPGSLE